MGNLDTETIFKIAREQILDKGTQYFFGIVIVIYIVSYVLIYLLRNRNIIAIGLFVLIQDMAAGIKTVIQVFVGVTVIITGLWFVKEYDSVSWKLVFLMALITVGYSVAAAYLDMFFQQRARPLSELLRQYYNRLD